MTKELYERLVPFQDLMRTIIINSSASNLPIEYRSTLEEVGNSLGIKLSCNCSSGWFTLTSKLYAEFVKYKTTEDGRTEEKTEANSEGASPKNSNRKSSAKNKRK